MPMIDSIRLLNNVVSGTTNASALQTALGTASTLSGWQAVMGSPQHLNRVIESDTAWAAVRDSDLALSSLAASQAGAAKLMSNAPRFNNLQGSRSRMMVAMNSGRVLNPAFTARTAWIQRHIFAGSNSNNAVCFGNGLYVTAGQSGYLSTSPDAVTWTARTSGTASPINGLAYGAGTFVYVANNGVMQRSADGITWTSVTHPFSTNTIYAVIYAGGQFVAVSGGGLLATSPDGITWTSRTSGFGATAIRCITHGNGRYFIGGESGKASYSDDGITWTHLGNINSATSILSATYGDGLFVFHGASQTLKTSSDCIGWVNRSTPLTSSGGSICVYGAGLFITGGETSGNIATSIDGATWTLRTISNYSGAVPTCATYANGLFLIGGTVNAASGGLVTSF